MLTKIDTFGNAYKQDLCDLLDFIDMIVLGNNITVLNQSVFDNSVSIACIQNDFKFILSFIQEGIYFGKPLYNFDIKDSNTRSMYSISGIRIFGLECLCKVQKILKKTGVQLGTLTISDERLNNAIDSNADLKKLKLFDKMVSSFFKEYSTLKDFKYFLDNTSIEVMRSFLYKKERKSNMTLDYDSFGYLLKKNILLFEEYSSFGISVLSFDNYLKELEPKLNQARVYKEALENALNNKYKSLCFDYVNTHSVSDVVDKLTNSGYLSLIYSILLGEEVK